MLKPLSRNIIDHIILWFCRGVCLSYRRFSVRKIGTSGSADLSSSSSVLVLSLKADVEKVFIDTSFGYE